jgi:hypothetical protein
MLLDTMSAPPRTSCSPALRVALTACLSSACLAVLIATKPSRAYACTGPSCVPAEFFPARGSVPANVPAVLFWPASRWRDTQDAGPDEVKPGDVRFARLEEDGFADVAFELIESDEPSTRQWAGSSGTPAFKLVPKDDLQVGARYAVWTRACDGVLADDPPREPYDASTALPELFGVTFPLSPYAVFDVIAAAPLPSELGKVTLSNAMQREVPYGSGSACSTLVSAATVSAELEHGEDPFFDAIAFSTFVDGERYRPSPHLNYAPAYGDSWVGHGRDLFTRSCDPQLPWGLAAGKHSVHFEGRIAGLTDSLVGETFEVELSCNGGQPDQGSDRGDAGGSDAEASESSSCAVAGNADGGVLAVLLGLTLLRLRRARPSRR